jgi:rod shape-determining protein MreD
MIKDIAAYLISFVIYVLMQALVINNIQLGWYLNPFIYIGFLMMLPLETPKWLILVAGFLLGYSIDFFSDTPGMHAMATVFIAFIRPYLHNAIIPRDDFQPNTQPSAAVFGYPWFIKYAIIMVFLHHFMLFFIEVFSFSYFYITLLKTLVSGISTILLLLVIQLFSFGKNKYEVR